MGAQANTGIVDIRGKQYQTVALRVQTFRQQHPEHSLTTDVVERAEDCVVMRATIADANGRVIATGHAEEYRKSSQINRTSALENAETSAIGRALAAFGLGGTEFASANEVVNAIHQQGQEGQRQGDDQGTVNPPAYVSDTQWAEIVQLIETTQSDAQRFCEAYGIESVKELPASSYAKAKAQLSSKLKKMEKVDA